jgi:hypothetical protein
MACRRIAVLVVAGALLVVGCGDDDENGSDDGGSETTSGAEGGGSVTVTVSEEGLEVDEEVAGGAVEVAVEGGEDEIDFSQVESGTTEDEFVEGMAALVEGGPAPEFLLANAGVSGSDEPSTILLEPGDYFVWTESGVGDGLAPEGTPVLYTAPLVVTGEGGGELPETDGTFTASDYEFSVDASEGSTFSFLNDGPDQLHHAVLFNFGDLDPSIVEENFAAFAASEGEPPEALAEVDFENLEAGGSGVFSADGAGTFSADLAADTTYVVACFISDLDGGAPHAIEHDMWEVFTLDGS